MGITVRSKERKEESQLPHSAESSSTARRERAERKVERTILQSIEKTGQKPLSELRDVLGILVESAGPSLGVSSPSESVLSLGSSKGEMDVSVSPQNEKKRSDQTLF